MNNKHSLKARWYACKNMWITSKAALVILVWSFAAVMVYELVYEPSHDISDSIEIYFLYISYAMNAIISGFYPLAGFLADNKFGLYRTITKSLIIITLALLVVVVTPTLLYISMDWNRNPTDLYI